MLKHLVKDVTTTQRNRNTVQLDNTTLSALYKALKSASLSWACVFHSCTPYLMILNVLIIIT